MALNIYGDPDPYDRSVCPQRQVPADWTATHLWARQIQPGGTLTVNGQTWTVPSDGTQFNLQKPACDGGRCHSQLDLGLCAAPRDCSITSDRYVAISLCFPLELTGDERHLTASSQIVRVAYGSAEDGGVVRGAVDTAISLRLELSSSAHVVADVDLSRGRTHLNADITWGPLQ